jgi:type III secretory pathway component EscT
MTALPPALTAALLGLVVRLVLVSLRIVPLTLTLPFLGGQALPAQARLPVLLALAVGAAPAVLDAAPVTLDLATLLLAVAREVTVGVVLALVVGTPFFALEHGGRLLDAARGANVAEVIAPETGARTSPLAELMRWTFAVVFLAAGGLRAVVRVVASSFAAVPPDPAARLPLATAQLVDVAARWTADALAAGLTLVGAGLLALVAAEAALGMALRLSPPLAQSNIALPVRALAPLAALAVTVVVWTGAARDLARDALGAASALFR